MRLKSLFRRGLLPGRLRTHLNVYAGLGDTLHKPEPFELRAEPVLVLAPHPDDEAIGCGGTLHRLHQAGARITCLFLTHGSEEAARRQAEARDAAVILGIDDVVFWDEPPRQLEPTKSNTAQLAELLRRVKPAMIFTPFPWDYHPDHLATNRLLRRARRALPADCSCLAYEVWTPGLPNTFCDIADVLEVKRRAIEQYASQLKRINFVAATEALAKYRSVMLQHGDSHVEAFLRCPPEDFFAICRRVSVAG